MPLIKSGLILPRGLIKSPVFILNKSHPLSRGMVGCWPLGDAVSGCTRDISSFNNAALLSVSSPTFAPSHHGGRAIALSGSMQLVQVPYIAAAFGGFSGKAPITMSVWINWVASTDTYNGIIAASDPNLGLGWALLAKSNQKLAVYFSGPSTFSMDGAGATVSFNTWHHIVATYDGSTIVTYIDSVQNSSTSVSGTYGLTTNSPIIGGDTNTFGTPYRYFDGSIEGTRIYNRALSTAEVAWLYAEPYAGLIPSTHSLVGFSSPPPVLTGFSQITSSG